MSDLRAFWSGALAMAGVLVVSNYLVQFPLGDWLTWAAFTYPVAFLVTDCVNRARGAGVAGRVAVFGFVFGVPLSFVFNYVTADAADADACGAARIAVASGIAFGLAQAADIFIFDRLRAVRRWWLPPLASSSPASVVDTAVFFGVAFAGTSVPWVTLAVGDFAVKVAMVLLLLLPYRFLTVRRVAA